MTTTPTTDLQGILSAKKAELNGQPVAASSVMLEDGQIITPGPQPDGVPHDVVTGEIVPVAAADVSPTDQGRAPALPVAAPAPVEVRYPEIPPKVVGGLPYIRDYVKLARTISQTEMVPVAFRGAYDKITAAFMRGYEMGLGPMQALDSFNVIQGKVGLTAEAMRALILNAGHDIILEEFYNGDTLVGVHATCHRKNWPNDKWAIYTYAMDDARRAGLLDKKSWKDNPRAMLDARATSGAGRRYFADVLAGMSYTPEEIRDFSGPEQEVTPSPPPAPPAPAVEASAPTSSPASEPKAAEVAPTVTDPPKRPRGRPKKATTPPVDAPGPSVQATQPSLVTEPPPVEGPPETTSLNEPTDAPGVQRQMFGALVAIIKGLPTAQQPLCRAFLNQHYPNTNASELGEADLQKCIDIAAGWPDSAEQHPVLGAPEQSTF